MALRRRIGIFAVCGALALAGACDLNPQPIPPGFTGNDMEGDASPAQSGPAGGSDDGGDGSFKGADGGEDASDANDDASEDAGDSGDE